MERGMIVGCSQDYIRRSCAAGVQETFGLDALGGEAPDNPAGFYGQLASEDRPLAMEKNEAVIILRGARRLNGRCRAAGRVIVPRQDEIHPCDSQSRLTGARAGLLVERLSLINLLEGQAKRRHGLQKEEQGQERSYYPAKAVHVVKYTFFPVRAIKY